VGVPPSEVVSDATVAETSFTGSETAAGGVTSDGQSRVQTG